MPFGSFLLQDGKDNNPIFPAKFFKTYFLLLLGCVQSVLRYVHLRLALVPVLIQTVTAAYNKGERYKYCQVKQENGRVYPVMCKIPLAVIFFWRVFVLIHSVYFALQK